MIGNRNSRGAKHRLLVLMYFVCFILSLAPTIVAPPERGFSQGQPEMHQAMDNMVSHGILLKKTGPTYPPSDVANYPALFTSKTNNLLDEAEQVLSTMQNSQEKQWIKAFVQRMKAFAVMLEKTAETNNQPLPKNQNRLSGITPVPEGLPSQPTGPELLAVRGSNPFQKPSKMMSKFPVTSPELSQVLPDNEYTSERQVVTKPAMMSSKSADEEEDELVRELENLHEEAEAALPLKSLKVIAPTTDFTSPVTPAYPENIAAQRKNVISAYQLMDDEFPKKLVDILNGENKSERSLVHTQKVEQSRSEESDGIHNNLEEKRMDYMKNVEKETLKSKTKNSISDKKVTLQSEKPQIEKENSSYQTMHLHPDSKKLPKLNNELLHKSAQSKSQPYLGHVTENIQKPKPFNFRGNYRVDQQNHMPEALKHKIRLENRMYNGHLPPSHYEYMAKTRYRPYGYSQPWDHINSTINFPAEMSSYIRQPMVNHQIETQLNDEMKRQLRDGKIVVLSDSVVRSNFDTNAEGNKNANRNTAEHGINDQENNTQNKN